MNTKKDGIQLIETAMSKKEKNLTINSHTIPKQANIPSWLKMVFGKEVRYKFYDKDTEYRCSLGTCPREVDIIISVMDDCADNLMILKK